MEGEGLMFITFGTRNYGKVDRVPGLFYVVTRFVHVMFIPLLPLESYVILDTPGGKGQRGLRIPMSVKSMLMAWLRGACITAAVICAFVLLANILPERRNEEHFWTALAVMGASLAVFGLSYLVTRASAARAAELGNHLGIPEEALADLMISKEGRRGELEAYLAAKQPAPDKTRRRARRHDDEDDDRRSDTSIRRDRRD
jgi:hypothetical protein